MLAASSFLYGNDLPVYVYFLLFLFAGFFFSGWMRFGLIVGALRVLPSYDTYLSVAALALSLLAYGLCLALPALASTLVLAFVALLDLGFMGLRIFAFSKISKNLA